ncbi:MAG: hypothetical protein JNM10_09840 [Planctomycetia bacterium]|nr:hypothetical protein [Planctomycetia bacterium]
MRDIYTGRTVDRCESIDHFLPWSFVAHDQQWNLVPVGRSTNLTKSDSIPDLGLHLPRLASAHHAAVRALRIRPRLLEDHVQFFGRDVAGWADAGAAAFLEMYKARLSPQAQIAANEGFPGPWRHPSAVAHGRDGAR